MRATVDILSERIQKRNRLYEREIAVDYLKRLNHLYEDWFEHFVLCPVLTIPVDNLDFVANSEHLDYVVDKIMERLRGKEVVVFDKGG